MKTTIDMAREAGWTSYDSQDERFKVFEALVRADERKQVALDKKAENARELGLDYEPVLKDNSNYRYDPPAAQLAVPDAFGTREGEHPQYIQGWNDCRAEMLKGSHEPV